MINTNTEISTLIKPIDTLINGLFPNLFQDFVGQHQARKRLEFYLRCYPRVKSIPHLIFTAQKGNGKTRIAQEVSKGLMLFNSEGEIQINAKSGLPRRKEFIEVNCSVLTTVNDFLASWVVPKIQDRDVTILFDEASEIPHDITMALLTILNPNQLKTRFSYRDYNCDFDFTRQTFMFATSEPQKVFHALLNRFHRIDLAEYSLDEIAQIIQKGSIGIHYENGVLEDIASVSRGNARDAQRYASEIKTYLGNDGGQFLMQDWLTLKDILSIMPLGLNQGEIKVLQILQEAPDGTSLTCLASKMGMSRDSVQKDYELYLQKHSLISIEAAIGRIITAKGQAYLKGLVVK